MSHFAEYLEHLRRENSLSYQQVGDWCSGPRKENGPIPWGPLQGGGGGVRVSLRAWAFSRLEIRNTDNETKITVVIYCVAYEVKWKR